MYVWICTLHKYIHIKREREREREREGEVKVDHNCIMLMSSLFFLNIIIINRVWELVTDFYQFLEWGIIF